MKAVIMAGGEGKRLRPLTCTVPKPMAKILGKPIIEYIFDLLCANGVTHAAVTLGYLPHMIENQYENGYKNLALDFVREDEPLGTAGSVKNAASDFDEPFIVISGDAMCNFDLKKIMDYHKASGAKVTVVATHETDPREYGVIKVGKENRVTGFVEKPSWNQAVSNLTNTGVYIINPECLELIPKGKPYDFAADLFRLLLERDMPIYCYHTDDYWCDVGNVEAYLKCQRDAFDGRIKPLTGETARDIYTEKDLPAGDYSIIPPVYIGRDTEIGDGAVIGPYAVVDSGCSIGANSRVRYSVVGENSCLAANTAVTGALICPGAALRSRCSMFENSVAGSGSVIGEDACVKPGVCIWPGKLVGKGATVASNLKYGSVRAEYFSGGSVNEKNGVRLNAETCVRLGLAAGSAGGRRIAVGDCGTASSRIMRLALIAGLAETGTAVWDMGECFEAQLNYIVNVCGLDAGLFAFSGEEKYVSLCADGGLSASRSLERQIEAAAAKGEFRESADAELKEPANMSEMKKLYTQGLMAQAPEGLKGTSAVFECENEKIKNLASSCASKLGAESAGELIFRISADGTKLSAVTGQESAEHDSLLAVCCLDEMRKGRDVAVPYDAPAFFDSLAEKCGRRVLRYLSTPADGSDSRARQLAVKQPFVRDGLFLAVKLLAIMRERNCSLDRLLAELPEKFILRKTVKITFSPSYLVSLAGENCLGVRNDFEGIKIIRDEGRVLIIPERGGESVRILAESNTMEAAQELCADVEDIINTATEKL